MMTSGKAGRRLAVVVLGTAACLTIGAASAVQPQALVLFQGKSGHGNMISIDPDEIYRISNLDQKSYSRFDRPHTWAYIKPGVGLVALYRDVSASGKDHLFSLDLGEGALAEKYLGYRAEGICCFVFATAAAAQASIGPRQPGDGPAIPLAIVRLVTGNRHIYSTTARPQDEKTSGNVKFEGILGWVVMSDRPPLTVAGR